MERCHKDWGPSVIRPLWCVSMVLSRNLDVNLAEIVEDSEWKARHGFGVGDPEAVALNKENLPLSEQGCGGIPEVCGACEGLASGQEPINITGPLWGESISYWWIPLIEAGTAEL